MALGEGREDENSRNRTMTYAHISLIAGGIPIRTHAYIAMCGLLRSPTLLPVSICQLFNINKPISNTLFKV